MKKQLRENIADTAKIGLSILALCVPGASVFTSVSSILLSGVNRTMNLREQMQSYDAKLLAGYRQAVESALKKTHDECMRWDTYRKLLEYLRPRLEAELTRDLIDWDGFTLNLRRSVQAESGIAVTEGDWRRISDLCMKNIEAEIRRNPDIFPDYAQGQIHEISEFINATATRMNELEKKIHAQPAAFSLSEQDDAGYRRRLKTSLDRHYALYESVELAPEHEQYLREIRHQSRLSWKGRLISELEKAQELAPNAFDVDAFRLKLNELRGTVRYDEAREIALALHDVFLKNHPAQWKIRKMTKDSCNKVFVVTGEPGSGKSQLLKDYARTVAPDEYAFPVAARDIADEKVLTPAQAETYLLSVASAALGREIDSFDRFAELPDRRFVFLIDDLQKLSIYEPRCLDAITHAMRALSRIDNLSWLVAVGEYDLYILRDESFINGYCYLGFRPHLYAYALCLSAVNNGRDVGKRILAKKGISVEVGGDVPGYDRGPLNVPLYAHILARFYSDSFVIDHLVTYHLFVRELVRLIEDGIKTKRSDLLPAFHASVQAISHHSLKNANIRYSQGELNSLFREGTLHSEDMLRAFRDEKLLSRVGVEADVWSPHHGEDIFDLATKIYWVARMVVGTRGETHDENYERYMNMQDWKQDLIAFYLCFLDANNEGGEKTGDIALLLSWLAADHKLHYALFAAASASPHLAGIIREILAQTQDVALHPQEAYGLLYFFSAQNVGIVEQCKLIRKFLAAIDGSGLGHYVKHVYEKAFRTLQSEKKLKKGLVHFIDSDVENMNFVLGRLFADEYAATMMQKYPDQLAMLVTETYTLFYDHLGALAAAKRAVEELPEAERYDTFSVCFTRDFFHRLICRYGIHALYRASANLLFAQSEVGLAMRQGFARAAGKMYSRCMGGDGDRRYLADFRGVVAQALGSFEKEGHRAHLLAFHMLSNTLADDRDTGEHIDEDLLPYLDAIWKNTRMDYFTRGNRSITGFFKRNLTSSDSRAL